MNTHNKHIKIPKPNIDNYSCCDIGLLGLGKQFSTTTTTIQKHLDNYNGLKVEKIKDDTIQLSSKDTTLNISSNSILEYDFKLQAIEYDYALINGPQLKTENNIIFFDTMEEIEREWLSQENILAVITQNKSAVEKYFLKKNFQLDNNKILLPNQVAQFLLQLLKKKTPSIKGFILAGGKSKRMGHDKSQIVYHNNTAELYAKHLLEAEGIKTWLSKANTSNSNSENSNDIILDYYLDAGPMGAICSGFRVMPDKALLVLACDLPLIDSSIIQRLINNRDPKKVATCIKSKNKDFPEPLIAIYEPKAYRRLLNFMALGYTCPRKMLINSNVKVIEIDDDFKISNANTPNDYKNLIAHINNREIKK